MKLKKFNENDIDITANIKTNNIKDVEEFFDDVKKIHTKISNNDEEFTEDEDNELKYKTGRKFDEESNDNDTKLIVQDDNTKIKKFSEDNVTPDDYGYCPACDTKLIDEHCPRCKGEYDYDIKLNNSQSKFSDKKVEGYLGYTGYKKRDNNTTNNDIILPKYKNQIVQEKNVVAIIQDIDTRLKEIENK